MKIKVYVLDFEVPRRTKRIALLVGVPAALLVGVVAVAYAAGLTTFSSGETLSAATMNANFSYLQTEISGLQTSSVPAGTIEAYGGTVDGNPGDTVDGGAPTHLPPSGWLLCDGKQLNGLDATYTSLYAAIGTNYGGNKTAQAFNLPDLRGMFLRGVDNGAGRDPDILTRTTAASGGNVDDAVGSVQGSVFASHMHGVNDPPHAHTNPGTGFYVLHTGSSSLVQYVLQTGSAGIGFLDGTSTNSAVTGISIQSTGGAETRPINTYVNYIIKY